MLNKLDEYNKKNGIVPKTIIKAIKEPIHVTEEVEGLDKYVTKGSKMSRKASEQLLKQLEKQMREAAKSLDFELAAELRDTILELKAELEV